MMSELIIKIKKMMGILTQIIGFLIFMFGGLMIIDGGLIINALLLMILGTCIIISVDVNKIIEMINISE